MNSAKIRLSAKEMELVINADWILTKNTVIKKVNLLLGELHVAQQDILKDLKNSFPPALLAPAAKISKGENYKGLPYLVLDHPRYFDRENIFAIRSLFWWGNFFSITLHVSGHPKQLFEPGITKAYSSFSDNDFFICSGDNEWEHHFESDNYTPVKDLSPVQFEYLVRQKSFLKLAQKFPLQQWDSIPALLAASFNRLIYLLRN
jgi:hypothetical protein